jgi:hypothetical protein
MFVFGVNDHRTYAGQAIISERKLHDQLPGARIIKIASFQSDLGV